MHSSRHHMIKDTKIALFEGKRIRKVLHGGEWWFSVVDIIGVLTESSQPSKYWTAMKARVNKEDGFQLSTICRQLKVESSDAKAGGDIAGGARKKLEERLGRSIVTKQNFLKSPKNKK